MTEMTVDDARKYIIVKEWEVRNTIKALFGATSLYINSYGDVWLVSPQNRWLTNEQLIQAAKKLGAGND